MASKAIEREIAQLRTDLNRHNYLYYVEAAPEISDREYDRLMERLRSSRPSIPNWSRPTARPSASAASRSRASRRSATSCRCSRSTTRITYDELREWDARVRRGLNPGEPVRYVVELKVDGVAVSLRYEDGVWSWARPAATASTATTSRPTSRRSATSRCRSTTAPPVLEVRGEVYMTNSELVRLNELRAAGETPFANPRNSTAGSLKLLDPSSAASAGCGSSRTGWASTGGSTRPRITP